MEHSYLCLGIIGIIWGIGFEMSEHILCITLDRGFEIWDWCGEGQTFISYMISIIFVPVVAPWNQDVKPDAVLYML